MLPVMIQTT